MIPVELGSALPKATLVNQDGRFVELDRAFLGQDDADLVRLHALSRPYALPRDQREIRVFAGALGSRAGSPWSRSRSIPRTIRRRCCARYGAAYGADPAIWSLLTGTGSSDHSACSTIPYQLAAPLARAIFYTTTSSSSSHPQAAWLRRRDGRLGSRRRPWRRRDRSPVCRAIRSSASSSRSSPASSRFAAAASSPASCCSNSRSSPSRAARHRRACGGSHASSGPKLCYRRNGVEGPLGCVAIRGGKLMAAPRKPSNPQPQSRRNSWSVPSSSTARRYITMPCASRATTPMPAI